MPHAAPSNSIGSLQSVDVGNLKWKTASVAVRIYNPTDAFFNLDSDYVADSGVTASTLMLYCRPAFKRQFEFLQNHVLDQDVFGWILGPPGTGKSTTALAFVSTIPKMVWSVTWIHMNRLWDSTCLQFEADKKKAIVLSKKHSIERQLEAILKRVSKKHLVIIDGYAAPVKRHIDALEYCMYWRSKDRANRRLCVVCSMVSRGKSRITEDLLNNIKEHFVESWCLEEFQTAVENKQFYAYVAHNMDASNDDHLVPHTPTQLVESKFHFAGGSPRFMFQFNTDSVMELIVASITAVSNARRYFLNTNEDSSDNVINGIFSWHIAPTTGEKVIFIISQYAAIQLAMNEGPEFVKKIATVVEKYSNLLMDRSLLEMWFFASLCNGGVIIHNSNGLEPEKWPQARIIHSIDSKQIPVIPDFPTWFIPSKWNQGGYDAVFCHKAQNHISFVQVTHSNMHSFRIEYFYNLLKALSESQSAFEIKKLDIIFLVDTEKLQEFCISTVTGEGLLSAFPGWRKGHERENVKIYGISTVHFL
ncbi:hypothetical protein HDU83_004314 [Entophlyctis luteolus]|nr:hypothetical protein HDU83_004314 [Entophlyctis luteolus]